MSNTVSASIVGGAPAAMTPEALEAKMVEFGASYGPESIQSPRPAVPPPGKAPPLPPVAGAKPATPFGAKVPTDPIHPTNLPPVKLGQDTAWLKSMQAILGVLTRAGFDVSLVIDPYQDRDEYVAQELLVETYFKEMRLFDLQSNAVENVNFIDGVGYYKQPSIIWHILGVGMLVHGATKHAGFLKRLNREWNDVLQYVKNLTANKQSRALNILNEILRKHIKETRQIYSKVMLCDESIGFTKARAKILIDWTQRLKSDAYECWKQNRTRTRIFHLANHAAFVVPAENAHANPGTMTVENEFSDNEA